MQHQRRQQEKVRKYKMKAHKCNLDQNRMKAHLSKPNRKEEKMGKKMGKRTWKMRMKMMKD
jgi:hypothetical protein